MSNLAVLNLEKDSNTINKLTQMKNYFKESASKVSTYKNHGLSSVKLDQSLKHQEMLITKLEQCIEKAKDTLEKSFNQVSKIISGNNPSTKNILDAAIFNSHENEYKAITDEWGKVSNTFSQSDVEIKNELLRKEALPQAEPSSEKMGVLLTFPKK